MFYTDALEFKQANGYVIDGTWYPRVTKILEVKSKSGLEIFFKEMDSYASVEEVKNRSALEGSMVHAAVQNLLTGKAADIPEEIMPAVRGFQRFNETRGIVFHKEYVERQIKSMRHRYAGTVDALATIDGKFGVLDIKTSTGFYPEYNLQTAAYVLALQEFPVRRELALPRDIETRWILRINQHKVCIACGALLREKGGRKKIREKKNSASCRLESDHRWTDPVGDIELKEFPYLYDDTKAFIAAKVLWEWENSFWLRRIGYTK
ncbi:MAG: hypothetical protein AAB972_05320 [Patescibacteria group bacterium]